MMRQKALIIIWFSNSTCNYDSCGFITLILVMDSQTGLKVTKKNIFNISVFIAKLSYEYNYSENLDSNC